MTADFSLTSPEPLSDCDPNVFTVLPGRSYDDIALTSWLDAQHGALDIVDLEEAFVAVGERISRGTAWLKANDQAHPRYLEAVTLSSELENRRRSVLIQIRCAAYACWMHCCEVYAALQHIDQQAWIARHADRRFNGSSPQGIWRAVRGKHPPPGAWPQEHTELWIERRLGYVEIWNMDQLRERLHDRAHAD